MKIIPPDVMTIIAKKGNYVIGIITMVSADIHTLVRVYLQNQYIIVNYSSEVHVVISLV